MDSVFEKLYQKYHQDVFQFLRIEFTTNGAKGIIGNLGERTVLDVPNEQK